MAEMVCKKYITKLYKYVYFLTDKNTIILIFC